MQCKAYRHAINRRAAIHQKVVSGRAPDLSPTSLKKRKLSSPTSRKKKRLDEAPIEAADQLEPIAQVLYRSIEQILVKKEASCSNDVRQVPVFQELKDKQKRAAVVSKGSM